MQHSCVFGIADVYRAVGIDIKAVSPRIFVFFSVLIKSANLLYQIVILIKHGYS